MDVTILKASNVPACVVTLSVAVTLEVPERFQLKPPVLFVSVALMDQVLPTARGAWMSVASFGVHRQSPFSTKFQERSRVWNPKLGLPRNVSLIPISLADT